MGLRRKLVLLVIIVIVLGGCDFLVLETPPATWEPLPTIEPTSTVVPPTATPTTAPTATSTIVPTSTLSPTPKPTPTTSAEERENRAIWARDLAWQYLVERLPDDRIPSEPAWDGGLEDTVYLYKAYEWGATISGPTGSGEVAYDVAINGPEQFEWMARVRPDGSVEAAAPIMINTPTPQAVTGWRGSLHSLPTGAQFDDFFRCLGDPGGQYGITSLDPALEEALIALRDSSRIVRVWGKLHSQVPDYGEVQIIVDRLEKEAVSATPIPASEFVEAWVGRIRPLPPGSAHDDYFDAQYPGGQYGIVSLVPSIIEQLASYRDAGTVIRLWGILDYGVADYGGKQVIVTRVEVVSE